MSKLTVYNFAINEIGEYEAIPAADPKGGWVKYDDLIKSATTTSIIIDAVDVVGDSNLKSWKIYLDTIQEVSLTDKGFVKITTRDGWAFVTEKTMEDFLMMKASKLIPNIIKERLGLGGEE